MYKTARRHVPGQCNMNAECGANLQSSNNIPSHPHLPSITVSVSHTFSSLSSSRPTHPPPDPHIPLDNEHKAPHLTDMSHAPLPFADAFTLCSSRITFFCNLATLLLLSSILKRASPLVAIGLSLPYCFPDQIFLLLTSLEMSLRLRRCLSA